MHSKSKVSKMYYLNSAFANGEKLEGKNLKDKMRIGCRVGIYGRRCSADQLNE